MRQARITGVRETSRILAQTSFCEPQRGMGSRPTCRACFGGFGHDTLVRSTVSNLRPDLSLSPTAALVAVLSRPLEGHWLRRTRVRAASGDLLPLGRHEAADL